MCQHHNLTPDFKRSFLQTSQLREQGLKESVAFHQFQTDANDMEAWIMETLRQVKQTQIYVKLAVWYY